MTVFFVFTIMIAGYVLIIVTCYYCFRDGYKVGYKRGQALGYDEGFEDGHKKGLDEGFEDGHKKGLDEGFEDGKRYAAIQGHNERVLKDMGILPDSEKNDEKGKL